MPVGEQAAGGSLGTIFYPARPTARFACGQLRHLFPRSLPGRGVSSRHCGAILGSLWSLRSRNWFCSNLVTPLEISSRRFKGGEITATSRTAPWTRPDPQQESRPTLRVIVLHRPLR